MGRFRIAAIAPDAGRGEGAYPPVLQRDLKNSRPGAVKQVRGRLWRRSGDEMPSGRLTNAGGRYDNAVSRPRCGAENDPKYSRAFAVNIVSIVNRRLRLNPLRHLFR